MNWTNSMFKVDNEHSRANFIGVKVSFRLALGNCLPSGLYLKNCYVTLKLYCKNESYISNTNLKLFLNKTDEVSV